MHDNTTTAIIGRGKVGRGLHQLFKMASLPVELIGRSKQAQRQAVDSSQLIILCVTDDAIESLAAELAQYCRPSTVIVHCSGALGSEVLQITKEQGSSIASMHPLNTFPNLPASLQLFNSLKHRTHLFVEGDKTALDILLPLVETLGFRTSILNSASKASYHAACVFACNYLSVLMDLSLNTAEAAGLERKEFWLAIQPLIEATLSNISAHDTVGALSGPIARGDIDTIKKHLSALGETQASYQHLGLHALKLAAKRGELSDSQLSKMEALLS